MATWQAALGSSVALTHGSWSDYRKREAEHLSRLPMHATETKPTDWSLLPQRSEYWDIAGIVTGFSGKRGFHWFNKSDIK